MCPHISFYYGTRPGGHSLIWPMPVWPAIWPGEASGTGEGIRIGVCLSGLVLVGGRVVKDPAPTGERDLGKGSVQILARLAIMCGQRHTFGPSAIRLPARPPGPVMRQRSVTAGTARQ